MRHALSLSLLVALSAGCASLPIKVPEPFSALQIPQEAVISIIHKTPYSIGRFTGNGFFFGDKNCFFITYHQHKSLQKGSFQIYPQKEADSLEFLYAKVEFDLAIYRANGLRGPVRALTLIKEIYHPQPGEELLILSRLRVSKTVRVSNQVDKIVIPLPGSMIKEGIEEFKGIIFIDYLVWGEVEAGQSGSPLLNKNGKVIGIMHTAALEGPMPRPSFAIPLSQRLLEDIFKEINC